MSQQTDYRRGRHCVFNLYVHLVFVTKYRRGVLSHEPIAFLETVFTDGCARFDAHLIECNDEDDHGHLLIAYPPKVAVSTLVNSLKGASARQLRNRYRVRTHRNHLGSPSYCALSCGGRRLM